LEKTKPFAISKRVMMDAFEQVKASKGAAGTDGQPIAEFEENLKDNLYKLWNRMSSGTCFPPPVKAVPIPKKSGGTRMLGVPTVADRIAQATAKACFEPCLEPMFRPDSYGHRPGRSALDAVGAVRQRCWRYDWVLEPGIKGLFDNIDHGLLMEMVKRRAAQRWVILYIERWPKAPFLDGGLLVERVSGTPQGGVISPVPANLFLHYAFDSYMASEFPTLPWARYADDAVIHCVSKKQAPCLKGKLDGRFRLYKLELHPDKTKAIHCGGDKELRRRESIEFDFLGCTFRPRSAMSKAGKRLASCLPATADKAKQAIRKAVRGWQLQSLAMARIEDIARMHNPKIRGWWNYYGKYCPSEAKRLFNFINQRIMLWVMRKYKLRRSWRKARRWLKNAYRKNPKLFYHWEIGVVP